MQTLTNEELWHGISLLIRIDRNGNDGADIYEFEELEKALFKKYGIDVKQEIFAAYQVATNTKNNKQIETKKMAGINFNATEVAPNMGFSAVEKGKYPVIMSQSEFKPTSNGAGKLLEIHCKVNGGNNHGRDIMVTFNWENASAKAVEIGHGQFSAVCHAVNVLHVQDTQQLHNIPFILEVDVSPDGKYNNFVGAYPIAQAQPAMVPQQQFMPQQQPVMQPQAQPQFVPQVQQGYVQPQPQQFNPQAQGQLPQQQFVPQAQPQPVQQQYVAPTGQANPMADYQAMTQPQPQLQQPVSQPQQQSNDVPDWIKNQMQAQGAQPMGNP